MSQDVTDRKVVQLLDTYSVLAQSLLQAREIEQMDAGAEEIATTDEYNYYTVISYTTSFLQINLTVVFANLDNPTAPLVTYTGQGAGLISGSGSTIGKAWLNCDINTLIGQEANFWANFTPIVTDVNFFTLSNAIIGAAVGGPVGSGITGGKGIFQTGLPSLPEHKAAFHKYASFMPGYVRERNA